MGTPMMALLSIIVAAVMVSSGANAQNHELSLDSCFQVRFPDLIGIKECLGNVLNMCGKRKCLMDAIFSIRSLKRILTALRRPLIFAFRTLFPRVSKAVVPVLKVLLPRPCNAREREEGTCDRQLLPATPCNSTVSVTFSDPLDVRDCIDLNQFMCFEQGADKDEMLIDLMRAIVCAMKKLPELSVRLVLKKLLCRGTSWLIEFLRTRDFKTMTRVAEAFHRLGSCKCHQSVSNLLYLWHIHAGNVLGLVSHVAPQLMLPDVRPSSGSRE
ncbi:uncharacterized protein [Dermacentor andersoni]|uniref:uncharacterized protein isoform X3 n=1 Tax=Dermacentor andersoni TaxID=34620 RepID=UPI0024174A2B|nr:uncharacterized protein LOC126525540 isoform X3 [Dermacentor andersoni]